MAGIGHRLTDEQYAAPRKTNESQIAAIRIEKGLTQAQLGELIGVAPSQIGSWERGLRKPKLDAVMRIADALGVDWKKLI